MTTAYATLDRARGIEGIDMSNPAEHAETLRSVSIAARVSFTWFGTRKTLNAAQKEEIGQHFGAEASHLSAGKKILDTKHFAYRACTAVRSKVVDHWRSNSLPYPEPGIRLIRQERARDFAAAMDAYREELGDAVEQLDRHYHEMREEARRRLGSLYNPDDYPPSLAPLFGFAYDFPNVEPPPYLMQLSPALYEQERARVAARFEEAVRLAEQAFAEEFAAAVAHLCERLEPEPDGTSRVFRDTAVGNLTDFFNRFRSLNIGSSAELDRLVEQAQAAVRGASPNRLRNSTFVRDEVRGRLAEVGRQLESMTTVAPRRRITRD